MAKKDASTKGRNSNNEEHQLSLDLVFTDHNIQNKDPNLDGRAINNTSINNNDIQRKTTPDIPPDKLYDQISKLKSKINRTLFILLCISIAIFLLNSKILHSGEPLPYLQLNSKDPIHRSIILGLGSIGIFILWAQYYLHTTRIKNCFIKLDDSNQAYLEISGFYDHRSNFIERIYFMLVFIVTLFALKQSIPELPILIKLLFNWAKLPTDWSPTIKWG